MHFPELKDFILNRMRMSHIYQPLMLITLLKEGGVGSIETISKELLTEDKSQQEYYGNITKNMVGRVLKNHGIVQKNGESFKLIDYETYTADQRIELIQICQEKLNEYIEKRGKRIFEHRRKSAGYISGSIRYNVLKDAKFRCELCGVSADTKALEVDHIIPRNKGGTDDISNLQALCYSCNAMKRDKDSTDFRKVKESYEFREEGCLFCEIQKERIVDEDDLCYVIRDGFPVTNLHTLIIPKYHSSKLNQLPISFATSLMNTIYTLTGPIEEAVGATATTIAFNNGSAAGQEVPHVHCHIIPRFEQDGGKSVHSIVENPSPPSADLSNIVLSIKNLI